MAHFVHAIIDGEKAVAIRIAIVKVRPPGNDTLQFVGV
jgi:hypothetical protein